MSSLVIYLFTFKMRLLVIISVLTYFISKQAIGSANLSFWINVTVCDLLYLLFRPFSHFLGWNSQTSLGDFFQSMADGQWPQDIKWTAVLFPFCTFLPQSYPHSLTSKIFVFLPFHHHSYHKRESNQVSSNVWTAVSFPTTFRRPTLCASPPKPTA